MKTFIFFLIILLFKFPIFPIEINNEDRLVLEKFFKTLFENSECGYVLFNKKPLCTNGFWIEDPIFPGLEFHERNVYLKEGAYLWKKLNLPLKTQYSLIVSNSFNEYDENIKDIHFIHRDLLFKTINDEITLFKYILGPDVTADQILSKLLSPETNLGQLLNQDNALMGIILGFGTQNSLIGSRMEQLLKQFSSAEIPPLKPLAERLVDNELLEKIPYLSNRGYSLFVDSKKPIEQNELIPSLGYDSVFQEYITLSQKVTNSSEKLDTEKPWFIFTRLKNDPESVKLVKDLEATQEAIQELLNSQNFFPNTLQTIVSDKITFQHLNSPSILSLTFDEIHALPSIIAVNIYRLTNEENDEY